MAKHKGHDHESSTSYYLEEPIEVPFRIAGYGDWLEGAVPEYLRKKALIIRPQREEQDMIPVLSTLWEDPVNGLDLESGGPKEEDGLDPLSESSEIILGQFGTKDLIWVVQPDLIKYLKEPLENDKSLHINQNITFDFKWLLKKKKIHLVRMFCTMLAEQVLRAGRDGFGVSLLDLARYHPPCRLISKQVRAEFIQHNGIFTEEQLYYAARDVFLLFPIFLSQNQELQDLGLVETAKIEFECIPATAEMELSGVWIDTDILDLAIEGYWKKESVRLGKEILDGFNDELKKQGLHKKVQDDLFLLFDEGDEEEDDFYETFNLDASVQILHALQRIGISTTDVKRETLKKIEHRICSLLVDRSVARKLVSTYGDRLKNMVHPSDGRLHPRFKQLGMGEGEGYKSGGRELKSTIATGRYSSDFQNLPRPADIYASIDSEEELALVHSTFHQRLAELAAAA